MKKLVARTLVSQTMNVGAFLTLLFLISLVEAPRTALFGLLFSASLVVLSLGLNFVFKKLWPQERFMHPVNFFD